MKKILFFLIVCLTLVTNYQVLASNDALKVMIASKNSDQNSEIIEVAIDVENTYAKTVRNITYDLEMDEQLTLVVGNTHVEAFDLMPNAKKQNQLQLKIKTADQQDQQPNDTQPLPNEESQESNDSDHGSNQDQQPNNEEKPQQPTNNDRNMEDVKTADTSHIGLWIILMNASLLVMVLFIVFGKKKQVFILVLCASCMLAKVSMPIYANEQVEQITTYEIHDGKQTYKLSVKLTHDELEPLSSDVEFEDLKQDDQVENREEVSDDQDQDGLRDDDELLLGLDPNNPKSDGVTLDSERLIKQVLSNDCIAQALMQQMQVQLQVTTYGNINHRFKVKETTSTLFFDSRALIAAMDIEGYDFHDAMVSFSFIDGIDASNFIICKYENEQTTYLETTYDENSNTICAAIDAQATYFIIDGLLMIQELGVEVSQSNMQSSAITRNQTMAQADIVFVIDSTASMQEELENVRLNINNFVNQLKNKGISPALALVTYQDITYDGYESTFVHQHQGSNWFYDLEAFKQAISQVTLGHGGDKEETLIDALETARELDMRASYGKIFVVISDAGYKVDNRYNIPSMDSMIHLLNNEEVQTNVITSSKYQETYRPLYERSGGAYFDIQNDFAASLSQIVDQVSNKVVGDGHWIYLDGPLPLPVRLDEKPSLTSNADTDQDGIKDKDELTSVVPTGTIDLDALITLVSKGVITNTNYGVVETYTYRSNPILADTDYDGVIDIEDNTPKENMNKGVVYYDVDGDSNAFGVEFTMDYRTIIEQDPKVYSKQLAILSSLFAADVYTDTYVKINEGAITGGNDSGVELGNMLGLEDTQLIPIQANDYDVDKDDLTAFFVGHKKMIYQGKKQEVIIVSVRGTNGTNIEWSSNFDVGADTSEYYKACGTSHPHWRNKLNHKGFDVATNRVYEKLQAYINANVDQSSQLNILITGHSRGAAIANILGSIYENDPKYKSQTYTFASPNVTEDVNARTYKTIFNIVNTDDIITYLPLESWGFTKFGTTYALSVEEFYENEVGEAEVGSWEWLMNGTDYNDDSFTQSTVSNISKVATCREDLYVLETADIGKVWENDWGHTTLAGAQEEVDSLKVTLENEKLLKYCNIYTTRWGLLYYAEINYCPAYLLQTIANMATGVGPLLGRDVAGKYATAKTSFVASSGKVVIGGMTHPHIPGTYYLMVFNDLKPIY